MTDKEAMKLALFALDIVKMHYTQSRHVNEAITALKERLADPMREVQRLGQEIEQEPVYHLRQYGDVTKEQLDRYIETGDINPPAQPPQRTEQEPVAWPCLIDSADFSENTITLVMQCEDYKVSAGTHWLSTTPPQRTEEKNI
jgi:hypothetical protein